MENYQIIRKSSWENVQFTTRLLTIEVFMKKTFYILFAFLLCIVLNGCLSTFFPIFHEKDAFFNSNLLGTWKYNEDKHDHFMEFRKIPEYRKKELTPTITKISDKGYLVTKMDSLENPTDQSFVFLVSVGKNNYLDFYPAELPSQKNINGFFKDHFIKIHTSYKIEFKDNDHFEMKRFDKSFLDDLISNNKINIRHEFIEGNNVITANTDDLQKFIIQYSDNPKMFMTGIKCERSVYY